MKRNNPLLLAFIIISISCLGESISAQQLNDKDDLSSLFEQKLAGQKIKIFSGNAIGSFFLNDKWCNGNIHLITGNWVKNKQLKYNSLTDDLIWLRPSDYSTILLEKDQIMEFNIRVAGINKSLKFKKMGLNSSDSTKKFYEVLYEAEYGLYCHRKVINAENTTRKADYAIYSIPVLKKAPVFIISTKSGKFLILEKISNRSLIKSSHNDKSIIKSVLRDEHIRLKTEEDLITIVKVFEKNNLLN